MHGAIMAIRHMDRWGVMVEHGLGVRVRVRVRVRG